MSGDDLGWAEWLEHHCRLTGFEPPAAPTKAYKAIVAAFRQRRQEGYSLDDLKLASVGAWNDQHRREHGYHTPDSVLRPTKVHGLIQKGRASRPAQNGSSDRPPVDPKAWRDTYGQRLVEVGWDEARVCEASVSGTGQRLAEAEL